MARLHGGSPQVDVSVPSSCLSIGAGNLQRQHACSSATASPWYVASLPPLFDPRGFPLCPPHLLCHLPLAHSSPPMHPATSSLGMCSWPTRTRRRCLTRSKRRRHGISSTPRLRTCVQLRTRLQPTLCLFAWFVWFVWFVVIACTSHVNDSSSCQFTHVFVPLLLPLPSFICSFGSAFRLRT